MYEKLAITENHLQTLVLFTRGFNKEYYIREVSRVLGMSPRTAQTVLDDLEKKAVLESTIKGKIRTYKLRSSGEARNYLILVEQYKKIIFMQKHSMVKEIIEKITPLIAGIGLVFGSYAKGLEKRGSDLDIFVAGECDKKEMAKVGETYGMEINAKVYPLNAFAKGIRKDILVKEVLADHVVFSNAGEFIGIVMGNDQD
ncbi:MAG: nucleotidyltransferase domain-containing protein [Candidatus Aenigmarchaeota archaeon]|nr:nucleotidyltransferase domain-containing protein [Candidatus Aenigmarchaeota archaeon]